MFHVIIRKDLRTNDGLPSGFVYVRIMDSSGSKSRKPREDPGPGSPENTAGILNARYPGNGRHGLRINIYVRLFIRDGGQEVVEEEEEDEDSSVP